MMQRDKYKGPSTVSHAGYLAHGITKKEKERQLDTIEKER